MASQLSELPSAGNAAIGYFVDQKKGEVNELKQLLKNINVERDMKRKREIIKKVIAYMTLGIDVSRLFTDMIMAIETKDIVVKKMVYLYLCTYASQEPDMAIMCINSLRRDCDNEDPMVRGLALRSLCNLRLESVLEYIEQPLKKSLNDVSAYVRKTGIMGVLKVYYLSPSHVESNEYVSHIYRMLQDVDANVVTNAIHVINELLIATGGIEVNQTMIMGLLNRIGEFSEWGLNTILDLVSRYKPNSEDETFAIMNLLDPVLRTANSGAVLATFKCFMMLTATMPDLQAQIYNRAKPPMLTLITGAHPEGQFTMLKHLEIILNQPSSKGIFDDEYRQFFVRYNEPPHVKHLKVGLLPLIANESNARDISTELGEYVTDVDSELSKRAVRSIGEIAMKLSAVAVEMTQTLLELIDMDASYIRAEAASTLASVVRIHPNTAGMVLPYLAKLLKRVDDTHARSSLIWMLGEFGERVVEAPYLLEHVVDQYTEDATVDIKLQVLTAAMKLFFKRPPEMQRMLGRLLRAAINETSNQDLHDRALLYYRLLSTDVVVCQAVFAETNTTPIADGVFAEQREQDRINKLFSEFNSLAVIFGTPSVQFIEDKYQLKLENAPLSDFDVVSSSAHTSLLGAQPVTSTPTQASAAPVSHAAVAAGTVNLLDWDDVAPVAAAPAVAPQPQRLQLKDAADLVPARFQQLWGTSPDVFNGNFALLTTFPVPADLELALRSQRIFTIASGPLPPASGRSGLKLFVYGTELGDMLLGGDGDSYLCQLILYADTKEANAVVKSTGSQGTKFMELLLASLSAYNPRY